jgi:hypothetical protein
VEKPEGKKPFGRLRPKWEDNIKMDLEEVGWGCVNWIELALNKNRWWAFVKAVMNLQVH